MVLSAAIVLCAVVVLSGVEVDDSLICSWNVDPQKTFNFDQI